MCELTGMLTYLESQWCLWGPKHLCPLALVKKPTITALLTPLILPLSVDMDREPDSHLSMAFCLTVCNINKNPCSSTCRPDRLHTLPTLSLHSAWMSAIVLGVWLALVRQINITLSSSLSLSVDGWYSLLQKQIINSQLRYASDNHRVKFAHTLISFTDNWLYFFWMVFISVLQTV